MPWTSTPRAARGSASRPGAHPELEHRPTTGERREPLGAGVDVGHVAVPVVVDVGEAVAVGRRVVALHAQQCGGSDGLSGSAAAPGPVERGGGLGCPRRCRRGAAPRVGRAVAVGRATRAPPRAPVAGVGSDDDVGPPRWRLHDPEAGAGHDHRAHRGVRHPAAGARRVPRPRRRRLLHRRAARGERHHLRLRAHAGLGRRRARGPARARCSRSSSWPPPSPVWCRPGTWGTTSRPAQLLRGTLPIAWPLFASCVLVHLLEAVSILGLGVLPLAVMTWFLVTAPVIGAERVGPDRGDATVGAPGEPALLARPRRRAARLPRRAPLRVRHRAAAAARLAVHRHRGHRVGDPGGGRGGDAADHDAVRRVGDRAHLPRSAGPHGRARPRAARG